jgi:hypothetical protein
MKRLALSFALALSALPGLADAQVGVQIQLGLPVAPPMVVVQPGIQVVENYDEEVFYTGGWYWVRRDNGWYRARGPRAAFVYCEPHRVPAGLVRLPPGHYRHWRREDARREHREWERQRAERHAERHAWKEHERAERHEAHREAKAERRAWKEHEKAEHREAKADRRDERHGDRGHGHD